MSAAALDPGLVLAEYARLRALGAVQVSDEDWLAFWQPAARTTGHVYFIQQGDDGPIKIGFATNVAKRLEQLQIGNPSPLHVRLTLVGDLDYEADYHDQFRHAHIRGEWFAPTDDLTEFIRGLADTL